MSDVMVWFSFAGAWLLFAGAVFQAALELREQDIVRGDIGQTLKEVPAAPPVSRWWWLLPPARYVLERRRWKTQRETMMNALPPGQRTALAQYVNKTTGWLLVGFGGFLIAVRETWEVCDGYDWPVWVFVVLAAAAAALSLSFTATQLPEAAVTDA